MKDYNVMSMQGIKDMDYITEFGLDPSLEGTPEINDAMMDVVAMTNIKAEKEHLINTGMTAEQAQQEAHKVANKNRKQAEVHLQAVTEMRGY